MGWLCFIISISIILYSALSVGREYEKLADEQRLKYLEEYADDLKQFNISHKDGLEKVSDEKNSDHATFSSFCITSLLLGIVAIALFIYITPSDENPNKNFYKHMMILVWGFISASISVEVVKGKDVKGRVYSRLESCRCPFCNAPLSYFFIKSYRDNERYFQKNVSEYDSSLRKIITKTQNWVKYDEHKISRCDYCAKEYDSISTHEECIDKGPAVYDQIQAASKTKYLHKY